MCDAYGGLVARMPADLDKAGTYPMNVIFIVQSTIDVEPWIIANFYRDTLDDFWYSQWSLGAAK